MKILQLECDGYRSLKHVIWRPGDLNVVIGPNGTGKSNLLRLLELISVSVRGGLGKYIQTLGGIDPLLWDGKAERIYFRVKTSPMDSWRNIDRESLTYELSLARLGQGSAYRVDRELLGNFHRVERGEMAEPFKLLEREGLRAVVFDEHERELVAPEESVSEEETLLSLLGGPFTSNHLIPEYKRQPESGCV